MNQRLVSLGARTLVSGLVLGFLAGLLLAGYRLWGYDVGRRLVLLPVLAKSVNQAVLVAVPLLLLWVATFGVLKQVAVGERFRALLATALPALPAAIALGYWLNKEHLPGIFELRSIAGNLGLVAGATAFTFLTSHLLHRWRRRIDAKGAPSLALIAAACALPVAANAAGVIDKDRFQGPKVIVLLIDVLRADHLSCYGYEHLTSPNIDRFALDSTLFESAIAQSSFTKTSIASLFSGLYPFRHRVYSGGMNSDLLSGKITTLAETLAYEDYLTAAWVENPQLRAYMGFDQGFAEYHDQPGHMDVIVDEFLDWIDVYGKRNRFFAYLHVLDLHGPYTVRAPYDTQFGHHADTFDGMTWQSWRKYKGSVTNGKLDPPEEDLQQLQALYDGAISFVDDQVGRLLQGLKDAGVYDESMIIITADHGEGFMEHDFLAHTNTPYEELIHIPMIVKLPHSEGKTQQFGAQVALVDVAPTVEEFVDLELEVDRDGKSLLPMIEGRGTLDRKYIYSEMSRRMAVRSGDWKFIHLMPGRPNELYNLRQDPGEASNVIEANAEIATDLNMAADAAAEVRESEESEKVAVDPATVERLRALGYL